MATSTGIAAPDVLELTEAILEVIRKATWADGSRLVDLDEAVLIDQLGDPIRAATIRVLAPIGSAGGRHGDQPSRV